MLEGIEVLCHSSIKIKKNITVYVDPYNIAENFHDADYIFITHEHYDHFSVEDIKKVMKNNTVIVATTDLIDAVKVIQPDNTKRITVKPNKSYKLENIKFETTVAYNKEKLFHEKEKEWVGYIITIENSRYYIAGDTDDLEELKSIKCDVAFVPVGGTYTMNYKEASDLVNAIKPKYAIPIHYGLIVGDKEDAEKFKKLINNNIEVKILVK